jgi:dihydroorotate dehydrogenase electron transfer subunit
MIYPIAENRGVSDGIHKVSLDIPGNAPSPVPGQFFNIRCGESRDPLLRRPFSMHRLVLKDGAPLLEILYRVVGKGTEWLSKRRDGETLDVIGPLGNGFILEDPMTHVALVARGIGIAPLYAVGEALTLKNPGIRVQFLMGARYRNRVFYEEELKKIGDVHLYTDDGSLGFHGRAPQFFRHLLESGGLPANPYLYACGPAAMLGELAEISEKFELKGQVALETHMGCGFGACLSCAIPLKPLSVRTDAPWRKPALQWSEDGKTLYSLVCKDGPIYDIREVHWDDWLA